MSKISKEELVSYLKPFDQDHLVAFWNELNEEEKDQLKEDIDSIDFQEVNLSFKRIQDEKDAITQDIDSNIEPVPAELKGSFVKSTKEQLEKYEAEGLKAIASGQVAVLLLAGGQGTRLGVNYPKGMYSVDLLSGKTLYQLQAERLIKIKELALQRFPTLANDSNRGSIPWYIMTSEHTQESTISYFKSNGYFGLDKDNFFLFEQFMLPCLTNDGKVILDQKNKISKAPDGNGGLYKALRERRVLDDMEKRGIKYVHVYCVDNILVKMADPLFIGFCIEKNANCAAKVVKKIEPDEKVGVICKVKDRFQVVEYSEISEVTRNLRSEDGDLVYNAGNICNHFLNTDFLNKLCRNHEKELKHHVAHKKIPFVDENGERVTPKSNNGIKLEKFVFDVFPFSTNFAIWEVPREQEFSPLKNSNDEKKETPTTCRNDLYAQHLKWLKEAGAVIESQNGQIVDCEISPLVSYNGENLAELVAGKILRNPIKIELDKADHKIKFNDLDFKSSEDRLLSA